MMEVVATVGVGTIGSSWATFFAAKGFKVRMYDVDNYSLRRAEAQIRNNLDFMVAHGVIEEGKAKRALDSLSSHAKLEEAVADACFVQESTPEHYEVKQKLFAGIEAACPRQAVIASSSSGLLMTRIQAGHKTPERCVVCHPFNPPHLVPVVEIVPGQFTSSETVKRAREFFENLGKVPVVLKKEKPGHIANRLQAALWREAISLVAEGVASVEDVDRAVWAGPGMRWAFMGPHMTFHLGGGKGGLKYFLDHLGPAVESWLEDLPSWTRIPEEVKPRLVEGVVAEAGSRSLDELAKWRDE